MEIKPLHKEDETTTYQVNLNRVDFLDLTKSTICGARQDQYGNPEDNFSRIANFWTIYLNDRLKDPDVGIKPRDVAVMMALMKIARIMSGSQQRDSYIDAIGYMAIGGEIAEKGVTG